MSRFLVTLRCRLAALSANCSDTFIQSELESSTKWSKPIPRSPHLRTWSSIHRLLDKIHHHVCIHASYSDMKTLLVRNHLCNPQVRRYLTTDVSNCLSFKASATPPPNRRLSLPTLNREFNDVVCVDHMHMGSSSLTHAMDVPTRLSAAQVVESTSLDAAILALESIWLSLFWPPQAIHGDGAFQQSAFRNFLEKYRIHLRPVPLRRHQ